MPKPDRKPFTMPGMSKDGKLTCTRCNCQDIRVVNSYGWENGTKARRRQCRHCGKVYTSVETFK